MGEAVPEGRRIEIPSNATGIHIENMVLQPHHARLFEVLCQAAGIIPVRQSNGYDLAAPRGLSDQARKTLEDTLQGFADGYCSEMEVQAF
ncbi:hypothetical protein HYV56_00590 [Candidatus Peregrinibacteria bacterium]|nr:hypothetical protein [Candidatus Peregrinibacteria bacterium]